MEGLSIEITGTKRVRDDSDLDSSVDKLVHLGDSALSSPKHKRVATESPSAASELFRVDSDMSGVNSPGANCIPNDILDILDKPDLVTNRDPTVADLDSVIKSFEEEILHPWLPQNPPVLPVVSMDFGDSDLGFLLEASDDELGLPPTISSAGEENYELADQSVVAPEEVQLSEILGFEDEFPSFDSFGLGIGVETQFNNNEFATVGELFDYDSADFAEFLYRPESLQAQ